MNRLYINRTEKLNKFAENQKRSSLKIIQGFPALAWAMIGRIDNKLLPNQSVSL